MSKFLKFIVHLVIFCTIICVLALTIPPFLGVYTAINDGTYEDTNLPMGSVTYAKEASLGELTRGDSILVQEEGNVYRYYVQDVDTENQTCTVVNSVSTSDDELSIKVKNAAPKVIITIGIIGYLAAATKSMEGMIILGLSILFLIILYVIAEIWKKSPEEKYEDGEEAAGLKSKKELRREEKEKARQLKEEEREIKAQSKEEKKKRKQEKRRKKKSGGFVDEIYDELGAESQEEEREPLINVVSEAHEELKKEISAAAAEEEAEGALEAEELPVFAHEEPEPVRETEIAEPKTETEPELEPEEPVIRKRAIPVWNADQLARKAKAAGDEPKVFEDEIAQVTFFDYSEIISKGGQQAEGQQDAE